MYPDTLHAAIEAAEVFTTVSNHKLIGQTDAAGALLDSYVEHDCDHSGECEQAAMRIVYLVSTGAMVTADIVRMQATFEQRQGFWALDAPMGHVTPASLAAMQILTTTLNADHGAAQDILAQFITEHGFLAITEVLSGMVALYIAAIGHSS